MKTVVLAVILGLLAISWPFGPAQAGPHPPGQITIHADRQVINFSIKKGLLVGLASDSPITPDDIESVAFCSDRIGWEKKSACQVPFGATVTIPKTPNNDTRATWAVKLKSGKYCYFILGSDHGLWDVTVSISGVTTQPKYLVDKVAPTFKSYLMEYGNYQKSVISFSPNQIRIQFGCNLLIGLTEKSVDPASIKGALWNSDKVGWKENSTARGKLHLDHGNYVAVIDGTPREDEGNFCLQTGNTSYAWTIVNFWKFEKARVTVKPDKGFINYQVGH